MKKCPPGQYYCFTDKKCKKIPSGYYIGGRGMLASKPKNGNGNGNGSNGNGNGNGNGGVSPGNGGGNGGNGSGSGNGGSSGGGMGEEVVHTEGTLRNWFKGSRSKGGKPGWVQVVSGKPCARQPGQKTTPKCVSSAKRASMSDAERKSAQRRKRKADPGQPQKTGAAKPTYVSTDSPRKKSMKEGKDHPKNVKGIAKELDKAVEMHKSQAKRLRKAGISEGSDKKGKGSGTKDACYHKVKSRYSVWPSAYASGALVKCRKVGAANWGNSTKKEEFSNWREELSEAKKCWKGYKKAGTQKLFGKTYNRCVKKEQVEEAVRIPAKIGNIVEVTFVFRGRSMMIKMFFPKVGIPSRTEVQDQINNVYPGARLTYFKVSDYEPGQPLLKVAEEQSGENRHINETVANDTTVSREVTQEAEGTLAEKKYKNDPCWDSHKMEGMKKKGNKMVPNCVPRNEEVQQEDWQKVNRKDKTDGLSQKAVNAYRRENPGSKLKTAVTTKPSKLKKGSKDAKRRKSFCSRMKGMKKRLTSAKTARDPDSRINKALRRWNC